MLKLIRWMAVVLVAGLLTGQACFAKDVVHDAEYYILKAQNGEKWACYG